MKKTVSSMKSQWAGLVFTLPIIIGLLIFLIPTVYMGIRFAFSTVDLSNGLKLTFNGLENFRYALRVDANYFPMVITDIQSLFTTLPIIIIFSLFVAVLLNCGVWGRTAFRAIFFLPVIACAGMLAVLDSNNLLMSTMSSAAQSNDSNVLSAMSNVTNMLQSMNFSPQLISIVAGAANNILDIVNRSGVQILIFLAGIQAISPSIYESANVEGASSWEIFWKITLPMIMPMIFAGILYTFVESITRDNTLLINYIKDMAFTKSNFGYSAAMVWFHYLMLLLVLAAVFGIIWIGIRMSQKREYH